MTHINYYFSTLSPYAYLAGTRLEEIAGRHGATITYKPLDIGALYGRTGGTMPADRHVSRMAYRMQELKRQSKKQGVPMNFYPAHWPTNAAPSSYAIIAAQKAGGGDLGALCHGIMRCVWEQEKDIALDDVVKGCLSDAGFDPSIADSGLLVGAETYPANLEDAVKENVFGSPFYVVDGVEHFWGQDRLDDLDAYLANL